MKKSSLPPWAPQSLGLKFWHVAKDGCCHILNCKVRVKGERGSKIATEYVGIVVPKGYLYKADDVAVADEVKEYGFTNAMIYLCPESFKDAAGTNWLDYLLTIIEQYSPNSYLLDLREKPAGNDLPALNMLLNKDISVSLDELWSLFGNLTCITIQGRKIAAPLSDYQAKKASELGINHMEALRENRTV